MIGCKILIFKQAARLKEKVTRNACAQYERQEGNPYRAPKRSPAFVRHQLVFRTSPQAKDKLIRAGQLIFHLYS
jgi:hypothetical protein